MADEKLVKSSMPQTDTIPKDVLGDIDKVRPLGKKGGFSHLFRGHKTGLDVDVVIKRIKPDFGRKMDETEEAHILTELRHQYLPRVYDLKKSSDGYIYMVMEYIHGMTLTDYIAKYGELNQKLALKWTREICQVVNYMHTRKPHGIIHSDLKPDNIMVTKDGNICVIDFNASLKVRSPEDELQAIGISKGYAAPEQYNRPLKKVKQSNPYLREIKAAQHLGYVTYRTDIYSIGAVAYFMLTGYAPNLWTEGVIPLNRFNIQLGEAFRTIIERAMMPDPHDRFGSAASMYDALCHLDKVDSNYLRLLRNQRLTAVLVGLGLFVGTLTMFYGYRTTRVSLSTEYTAAIEDARNYREDGQGEKARELLEAAIQEEPSEIQGYLELAALYYQRASYQEAIDLLKNQTFKKNAVMTKHDFEACQGELYYIVGSSYYRLGDYKSALTQYQLATSLIKDEPTYFRDLSICYARVGDDEKAQETLEQLKQLQYADTDVQFVEGELSFAKKDYTAAFEAFRKVSETATDLQTVENAVLEAAEALQLSGQEQLDTEIGFLTDSLARIDANRQTAVNRILAECLMRRGDRDQSAADYQKAIDIYSNLYAQQALTENDRLLYASCLGRIGQTAEEKKLLQEMADAGSTNYHVYMLLSELALSEGDTEDASKNYDQAAAYLQSANASDPELEQLREKLGK